MTVLEHCRSIAALSDQPGITARTFLSPAARECLGYFQSWAHRIGLIEVHVDAAGNFRAVLPGRSERRLVIGSHLDTVPNAGAFDGVLGVVLAMDIAESFVEEPPLCTLEIVGFSEEEGVRFGRPFIGSVAYVDGLNPEFLSLKDKLGVTVHQAIGAFGLNANEAAQSQMHTDTAAYLEFHIEQGPVLEDLDLPLGVVEAIAGQTRASVTFVGRANHAGTTPMNLRQDAFCAAAEWTLAVEAKAREVFGLVATVGSVEVTPGAGNVVPGRAVLSLDVRHAKDEIRLAALDQLLVEAQEVAQSRNLECESKIRVQQAAVPMDNTMVRAVDRAVNAAGVQPHRITSGAGHDAMVLARRVPSAMIFLRSPGGLSHHPDESVSEEDVELALLAGRSFVENFV